MIKKITDLGLSFLSKEDLRLEYETLVSDYKAVVAERNALADELYEKKERMKHFVPDSTWYDLMKNSEVRHDRIVFKFWIYTIIVFKEDFLESLKNDIIENQYCMEVVNILKKTFDSVVMCGMCKHLTNERGKRIYCKKKHKLHNDTKNNSLGVYQSWYSFNCKHKWIKND